MTTLEPTMFREYDLRGRLNEREIHPGSVRLIASAYGAMLRENGIDRAVVGYDLRTGSQEMAEIAVDALVGCGINIIEIGRCLTPMMYAAQYHYESPGGLMVTASHNPNGWLGFKMALGYSHTFNPQEMRRLYALATGGQFVSGQGTRRQEDFLPIYTRDLTQRVQIARPVKVLVNAGNGTAGPIAPYILRAAGCIVSEFLTEPDLDFKRYFPNPSLEQMMLDTGEETVRHGAEVGFAFDGDGDRLGVTDEAGQIVWPDRYLILLSRGVLKDHPGASIVYDIKSSRALSEEIQAYGGVPVLWKTGHSYIKEKLHELGSPLAGEMSGHIFFGKPLYYGFDDGIFTALKMIEMLSQSEQPLSKLIATTRQYCSTPTLQAGCADTVKYELVSRLVGRLQAQGLQVFTFDDPKLGGRVEFPDGWGLVRASSNLPALVMRFEAETPDRLEAITQMFRELLSEYPEVSREWETG